jgi:hypothetical protein
MNPYAPPRAEVADTEQAKPGRPAMVWVISIFLGLGVIGATVSGIAALAGRPLGGEAAAQYVKELGPADHVFQLITTAITALGVVALFRLKRYAPALLVVPFVLGAAMFALNVAFRPSYRAMFDQAGGYWALLVGWAINLAIIGYAWRLRARNVLHD